jgi:hypothetical protein
VLQDIQSGQTLADSMRKHPKVFTDLYVNMVAAGEAGGILDTILMRLAVFLEKNDALKRKIKGAMVYPGVMLFVVIAAPPCCCGRWCRCSKMFRRRAWQLPCPRGWCWGSATSCSTTCGCWSWR